MKAKPSLADAASRSKHPRGYGQRVLYLDFDGVLHHEDVRWHWKRGAYMNAAGHALFEHAPLLDELLRPYAELRIVLSTSWSRVYGCYQASKRLPSGLRERVVGATFHSRMCRQSFLDMPRGVQVEEDVLRRRPLDWFALDDLNEGWTAEATERVVLTDPRQGIATRHVQEEIEKQLCRLYPGGGRVGRQET